MPDPRDEIARVIKEILAPLIQADGGSLELVGLEKSTVRVHLGGRYSGCPGNQLVIVHFLEPAVQAILPGFEVTVTSGVLVPEQQLPEVPDVTEPGPGKASGQS